MVFRYCLGMIMSVSTLMIFSGAATPSSVVNLSLDRLHVVVGEAEMMADLVNQHMADDMAQRLVMFGPIIQDGATIQPDHVGQACDVVIAAKRQAYADKQAEQVEFACRVHLVEDLIGGKIVDADDHALAQVAKALRQAL